MNTDNDISTASVSNPKDHNRPFKENHSWAEKHRPKYFKEQVGSEHVISPLLAMIRRNVSFPLVILSGHYGCGKTTTALNFARAYYCEADDPEKRPCGICPICQGKKGLNNEMHFEVFNAGEQGGVDRIRASIARITEYETTAEALYIIDEAHHLSDAAQTALLDVTEKPDYPLMIILVTNHPERILETLKSRGMMFEFHAHSRANVIKRISSVAQSEGMFMKVGEYVGNMPIFSLIADMAAGDMREAIKLLQTLYDEHGMSPTYDHALIRFSKERDDVVINIIICIVTKITSENKIVWQLLTQVSALMHPSKIVVEIYRVLYNAILYRNGESDAVDNKYFRDYEHLVELVNDTVLIQLYQYVKRERFAMADRCAELSLTLLQINHLMH